MKTFQQIARGIIVAVFLAYAASVAALLALAIQDRFILHGENERSKRERGDLFRRVEALEATMNRPRMMTAPTPTPTPRPTPTPADPISFRAYFSPPAPGDPTPEAGIVALIDGAKQAVRVQAYNFTARPIADALIRARARGVDVRVILDSRTSSEPGGMAGPLAQAGIPVLLDAAHAIAHNKVMVVDGHEVLGGSYNYSASAATRNAENAPIVGQFAAARSYLANWERHAAHSRGMEAAK